MTIAPCELLFQNLSRSIILHLNGELMGCGTAAPRSPASDEDKMAGSERQGARSIVSLAADTVSFGPFRLHSQARLLERDGIPVSIGSRALDILVLLVSHPGEVVRKDELIAKAWPDLTVDESSLRFHIGQLRRALADGQDGERYITNVPSRGYCFVAPVSTSSPRMQRQQSSSLSPPQVLPARLADLIGREPLLLKIRELLARERFVTLSGIGGIGKTAVAVALAHEFLEEYRGDIRFVDFSSIKDPGLVPTVAAAAVGLMIQSSDPTSSLIDMLRGRRMLLVLDNCEHVIDEAAGLAECIYLQAPAVSLLVTSREALRVRGEHVVEVPALEAPPAEKAELSASEVMTYPAAQLLLDRAAAAGCAHEVGDQEARLVARICRKVDGIALAIELAAGLMRTHGLGETMRLLDGPLRLRWQGRRTAPARHQTLNATLQWSYELLTDIERSVLQRLALFTGPFNLGAAIAVAADESVAPDFVAETLGRLAGKSLVSASPDRRRARYRLLDTMRAYALDKLIKSGDFSATALRHASLLLSELAQGVSGVTAQDAASERGELLADARAALDWAFSADGEVSLRIPLAAASVKLFIESSLLMECRAWAARGVAALTASDLDSQNELDLQFALGYATMFTGGECGQVEAALQRAVLIAERLQDPFSTSRLLWHLHTFYVRIGRYSRLLPIAQRSEQLAQQIGDKAGVARGEALLGVSYHLAGDQVQALRRLETSNDILATIPPIRPGHFAFPCIVELPLSCTLWVAGYPDQALRTARALARPPAPGDQFMYAAGLCWAAAVFRWTGDWVLVEQSKSWLAAFANTRGLLTYKAIADGLSGQAMIARGDNEQGLHLLRSALARLHAENYELHTSAFDCSMAEALSALGQHAKALRTVEATIARADGTTFDMPELLRLRGELLVLNGNRHDALASLEHSIALAEQQGALSWQLRASASLVRLHGEIARHDALGALAATYGRFTEGFETADLTDARQLLNSLQ